MNFMLLFMIVVLLLLGQLITIEGGSKNLICEEIGTCSTCRSQEIDAEYCRDTGKRMKIHCKDDENEFDDYKSCSITSDDDQFNVIIFQVVMAVVGGLAYWGVQSRKKYNMTLFDYRKLR